MPTELELTDAGNLRVLLSDATVCDPSVGPALGEVRLDAGQTFAGDVLSVNVQGARGLFAFNSSDDIDEDGIVGLPRDPDHARRSGRDFAPAARTHLEQRMEEFWAQAHHVRSLGRFLLDLAASTAVLTHVTRAFSITVGEGDNAEVVVIAS